MPGEGIEPPTFGLQNPHRPKMAFQKSNNYGDFHLVREGEIIGAPLVHRLGRVRLGCPTPAAHRDKAEIWPPQGRA